MSVFYPAIEIPLMCVGVVLWILCYRLTKKKKRTEECPPSCSGPPSVYVVPVSEEQREGDMYEAQFPTPDREPPIYSSTNVGPPPPYRLEPPAYQDSSYTDPPAYSEQP